MTMHGLFWRFPKLFTADNSAGIRPRSSYLKVIGDFARWNDELVFGCDDSAQKEFLNNLNPNKNTSEILKIQQIRSFESEIIQLADILIGAVGYQDRLPEIKTAPNATKLSLCKKIEEDLQINFNSKTPYLNTKFNLLIWEGQQ